jgi:anti-anti-sigma factor
MEITAEFREGFMILHLRGEFDTFYCRRLQEEVDAIVAAGGKDIALNLRLVRFINSTALGAIIRAAKVLGARGGKLVISRPSKIARDVIQKVGLDKVVSIHDSDEEAGEALRGGHRPERTEAEEPDDETAVLFVPRDAQRAVLFLGEELRPGSIPGTSWRGLGRMSALEAAGMRFTWNGGVSGMTPFEMGQFLAIGIELRVKFRIPLFRRGHCEAIVTVQEVEERPDGVKLQAGFSELELEAERAIAQYAKDIAFLKRELWQATGRGA